MTRTHPGTYIGWYLSTYCARMQVKRYQIAVVLNKRLKQVNYPKSLQKCAPISEFSFNVSTMSSNIQ